MFELEMDIGCDCPIGDLLINLEKQGGNIKSFVAVGPGGGNPCITFTFPSKEKARAFLEEAEFDDIDYLLDTWGEEVK